MDRNSKIKKLCFDHTIPEIAKQLNMNSSTVRSICIKNNYSYTPTKKGKKEGAYDKKPRTRRKKVKGGNPTDNFLNEFNLKINNIDNDIANGNEPNNYFN